jgi:hypothetical protein
MVFVKVEVRDQELVRLSISRFLCGVISFERIARHIAPSPFAAKLRLDGLAGKPPDFTPSAVPMQIFEWRAAFELVSELLFKNDGSRRGAFRNEILMVRARRSSSKEC